MRELTIQEACSAPASFMYVWANNAFLNAIDQKYARIIREKKANQIKLLALSAEKYLGDVNKVTEYYTAIANAFKAAYGVIPSQALVILAQGGTVAGKNWNEGIYGVGAVVTFSGHTDITVNDANGHIYKDGKDCTDESKTVYSQVNGKAVAWQLFAVIDGITYMSQYNKTTRKYHAQSYSTADGWYSANTGNAIDSASSSDVWGSIVMALEKFVSWILSIFGSGKEMINAENTLPNQSADGFVSQAGMGEAGGILLALAAGSALLFGMKGKGSKSNTKK